MGILTLSSRELADARLFAGMTEAEIACGSTGK
jgi:hypothetical protein